MTVVPNLLITTQNYYQAFLLCKDIDQKDTAYVALALQLNIPLLTRDKPFAHGLRLRGFTNIVTLDELFSQNDEFESTS
ncbi:PIN domain-containing protein [Spirosoma soli]|uniref:PIN domain-containing protein n=1 Tax=Spirosoma soli TaxID=1770529 RepID=A0ABW5LZA7_9BACT